MPNLSCSRSKLALEDAEHGYRDRTGARHQEDAAIAEAIQAASAGFTGSSQPNLPNIQMLSYTVVVRSPARPGLDRRSLNSGKLPTAPQLQNKALARFVVFSRLAHELLRLASTRTKAGARAMATRTLREAVTATLGTETSRSLEDLAVAAESDSFSKVRDAIDGMIRELKQQQQLDAKKKNWCKQEFFENERAARAAADHQTSLELQASQMSSDIKTLQGDLDQTATKREQLKQQLQTAGEERKQEQSAFQKTQWDQQMTIRALKQASDLCSGFLIFLGGPEGLPEALRDLREFILPAGATAGTVQGQVHVDSCLKVSRERLCK